jgi:hypothetical protein
MSKISKDDITTLFTDLVNAANKDTKEGKQDFIENMQIKRDKFNQPMEIPFANGNTINHSIARAIAKCEKKGCGLCISKDASSFGTKYGESPYIVFNYINDNDDVKSTYKKLFSNSYASTENYHEKKYTPLDFAKTCNPEFAEYMMKAKSFKESVRDAITGPIESLSNLAKRVTSSKRPASAKENKPESVKDEDLTVEQLEAKISELESSRKIRHYVFKNSLDEKNYKNSEHYTNAIKEDYDLDAKITELKKILKKKTKKSALSRARRVFGRKGGKTSKTLKHKKTNKRRSYRRK